MIKLEEHHLSGIGVNGAKRAGLTEEHHRPRLRFEVLLMGDNYQLSQVVTYLIENAMRTYPAGCEITVTSRV